MKSSEKETFVLIFSLSFRFILLADISISYFCFQVLSEEQLSHKQSLIVQSVLLICEAYQRALDGDKRGDSRVQVCYRD